MTSLVLNLDWGSCFLKACAQVRMPPSPRQPISAIQLLGKPEQGKLQARETLLVEGSGSLKAAYLSGRISDDDLQAHRPAGIRFLSEHLAQPLASRLRSAGLVGSSPFINIHTPLRLTRPEVVVGSGVFQVQQEASRLFRLTYRSLGEWAALVEHPAQPREVRWGHWLMSCLHAGMDRTGCLGEAQFSFLPESLGCVQDLAADLNENDERQFIVLDVGHFTTDFALVAFLNTGEERMVVRRADSIFDAGSEFIKSRGQVAWVNKVMKTITQMRSNVMGFGILGYAPLGVVLVGGGLQELSQSTREELLLSGIHPWAMQMDTYREGVERGDRMTYLAPPPHLGGDFQVLSGMGQVFQLHQTDVSLHVSSLLACNYADMRCPLKVQGDTPLTDLEGVWRKSLAPLHEVVPVDTFGTVQLAPSVQPVRGPSVRSVFKLFAHGGARSGVRFTNTNKSNASVDRSCSGMAAEQVVERSLGLGTREGEARAIHILEKMYLNGYLDAALKLAHLHYTNRFIHFKIDEKSLADCLASAAARGLAEAQHLVRDAAHSAEWCKSYPGLQVRLKLRPSSPTPNTVKAKPDPARRAPAVSSDIMVKMALAAIHSDNHQRSQQALRELKSMAREDQPFALFHLGQLLLNDRVPHQPPNRAAGFHYMLRAAKLGHRSAISTIADCYEKGIGTPASSRTAAKWRAKMQTT